MITKSIVKRIESGEEPVQASWNVDGATLKHYPSEQVRSDRKQAFRHSMILPILFFVILVVQTRAEDFSPGTAFWEYFRLPFYVLRSGFSADQLFALGQEKTIIECYQSSVWSRLDILRPDLPPVEG